MVRFLKCWSHLKCLGERSDRTLHLAKSSNGYLVHKSKVDLTQLHFTLTSPWITLNLMNYIIIWTLNKIHLPLSIKHNVNNNNEHHLLGMQPTVSGYIHSEETLLLPNLYPNQLFKISSPYKRYLFVRIY